MTLIQFLILLILKIFMLSFYPINPQYEISDPKKIEIFFLV